MDVVEYTDGRGLSPFGAWFDRIDANAAAKVTTAVTRLSLGNTSNVKGVGEGVLELKIDFGPDYRVYFGKDGDRLVILLAGGIKQRQHATSPRRGSGGKLTAIERKAGRNMALTRSFRQTVLARAERDPAFRDALLTDGIETMLSGDVDTGKAILRDYINATVGFISLAEATGTQPKSLMRMLGPMGNPTARNLMTIIGHLQRTSGISRRVQTDA